MAKSCSFVVKTPTKSLKTDNAKTALNAFVESIEKNAYTVALEQAGARWKTQKERDFVVVSTFFQRVCARTPLDEDYTYIVVDKDGKEEEREHFADENQCRYDWFVEKNGKRVTAGDIHDSYSDVFDTVNNAQSIKAIETYLRFEFGDAIYKSGEFIIGNENDHFSTLEYGEYEADGDIKVGEKYKHGVKNQHSVQAPVGMLRITRMELESLRKNAAKTRLSKRFRQQKAMKKDFSKDQLKRLLSKFKENQEIELSDIKEFLNI